MAEKKKVNSSELHAWSRHYDNLLWTVTGILAGANGGLLVYVHSLQEPQKPHWVSYVLGVSLSMLGVFFASSFRSARKHVHDQMEDGEKLVARGSPLWLFRQWWVFVIFWLFCLVAWYSLLIVEHVEYLIAWLILLVVCAVIVVLLAWFAEYPKNTQTAQAAAESDAEDHAR